ncbi:alpha-2-macroglobulin family protein [Brumimicrobium mesophilum]|uniref:alpha-2-macroglobulin family protein n=1 Tax=Brumimicrobium mesophilum TaxID=392717 RepID=UPI000D140CC2|nr:MG2 domain-containing protein [Brumimicrobium mesophilum]
MISHSIQRSSLLLFTLIIILSGCGKDNPENFVINPEYQKHISSFTSGVISSAAPIKIQLTEQYVQKITPNQEIKESFISITPSIEGKTVWKDQYTLEFIPKERFKSGETYWVEFDLGKVADVPKELKTFKFPFSIVKQAINFEVAGLKSYSNESMDYYQFLGTAITADIISTKTLSENIKITVNGESKKIKWSKQGNEKLYKLVVDSIPRKKTSSEIKVIWNTYPQGDKDEQSIKHEVPALGDFKVIGTTVIQYPEQYVLLRFSDPLLTNQNLKGLVEIRGSENVKTAISTNELRIYPPGRLEGTHKIELNPAIQNAKGYKFKKTDIITVDFKAIKPAVRLVGKGSILPSSNNMMVPFEAVNIKAVDLRIIKIFKNNMNQFFQNNDYDGSDELKRVGRVIRKKTIYLSKNKPLDLGKWNRFNLDLSEYIEVDQDAIYRIEIGFRKHHSVYPCNGVESESDIQRDETDWDEKENAEADKWQYVNDWGYDYYNYDYFDGYDYRRQDDPCSHSYYRNKSVVKNIFASDIGIIAKTGTNGQVFVAVSNIVSALPIQGATVKIYDYQQQLITKDKTDLNGLLKTKALDGTPFFIVIEHDTKKGYLRLGNGNSLPLSRFNIDGASVQEGIKGFIYGERGVWRPGDTLFLNFILEDKDRMIPTDHPVIFELHNARGQLVKREVRKESMNGFYNFTTPTDSDAPTGNWNAKVQVGGATFYKTIKVETIKPNRLKVNLKLNNDLISASDPYIKGDLTVKWLHGAPAKQLKTDISLKFVSTNTIFKNLKNYTFDDPSKSFYPSEFQFLEKKLNEEGKLSFSEKIEVQDQAPGMLKAIFKTRTFERGGDFSSDQMAVNYAPYDYFVGIQSPEINRYGALQTDSTYKFPIVSVDKNGVKKGNRKLEVEVYRIEWSWWWQSGSNNVASYINRNNVTPISREFITTNANGEGTTSTKIDKHDWGRYLIKVTDKNSGHSTGIMTYFDWPSWMSRSGRATPDGANMLVFSADKKEYLTGEKAKISFPSAAYGRALISIENGNKVIDAFWIETIGSETSFELPITKDLAPNCYVHITFLQKHDKTTNDAPLRMYGVVPIMVKNPLTILEPVIKMPDELAPETSFTVEVMEKNSRDMTYTIAVVDEGLLDLTRFKTPNPWNHFYAREALGVKTWDLFDHVIGAYGAKVENILTIGGDQNINPGDDSPIRFKPMVRFLGPFKLSGGRTAKHKINVPNYIGSVRTMVVAGQDGTYGSTEKTTPVKKPLMVLATLPRVLGPKEKVSLPVNVFAMDKKVKNVRLHVKTNSLVKVTGSSSKEITFDNIGDQVVYFDLEVGTITGAAKVEVIATSGNEKSTYEIDLEVRQPNLPITIYNEGTIEGGSEWSNSITLPGMDNSNTAKLELSTIPPINLEKRLGYLIRYPHGCLEQKTSGAFPQLYLESLMNIDTQTKSRIDNNVRSVINKIQKHQLNDGGFAYWQGSGTSNDWGTTYAGHFILEAEKKGYALPYGIKEKWINYQKNQAKNWNSRNHNNYRNSDLPQAYRLYTLALAGEPVLSAMNKLRTQSDLSVQAAWRLAAAYQIAGKNEVAKEIVRNKSTKVEPYTELSYTYGNNDRDQAMIIETLTLMGEKSKAAALVRSLSETLSKDRWMSTQTTAYSLMAIALFTEKNKPKDGMKASFVYNGKTVIVSSSKAIELIDLKVNGNQKTANVKIKNNGESYLFTRLIATGIPLAGNEVSHSNNLKLEVVYRNTANEIINIENIEQGTDFSVEVTVSNPGMRGDYKELALSQIFPSGWEIHNQRMDMNYSGNEGNLYDYQDIRDDRVYTYFDLRKNKSKTIKINLHAAYVGEYYMPAVHVEAMYDATISSLKKGALVKVVSPGGR